MRTSTSIIALALALCLPCAVATVGAQETSDQAMTVTRDADTGKLRPPTARELQVLQSQTQATIGRPQQPTLEIRPDGRRRAYLGESRLVYSVVTRGADGKIDQQCVDDAQAAERVLEQAAATPAHQESGHDHR